MLHWSVFWYMLSDTYRQPTRRDAERATGDRARAARRDRRRVAREGADYRLVSVFAIVRARTSHASANAFR